MFSLLSFQAYCFARNIGILFHSILSTKVEKCDFHWQFVYNRHVFGHLCLEMSWNVVQKGTCHSKAKIFIFINIKTLNMCTQEHMHARRC
jgi:hypothetical protein